MLIFNLTAVIVVVVLALFPDTAIGRDLRVWLIEKPARALNRAAAWRIAFYLGLALAGLMMVLLFETEGMIVYGAMAPEVLAWAVMVDVGMVIDALLIAAAVMAANGLRVARGQSLQLIRRTVSRLRMNRMARRRAGRTTPARPPVNDPEDQQWGWVDQVPYRAFSIA
jgi:hypothetical protein